MRQSRQLILWAVSTVVLGGWAQAEMKIAPLEVGPAENDVVYVVSPAGGHVAAGMNKGSRYVMAIDGVAGPQFDSIMMVMPAVGVASPGDAKSTLPGYIAKPINQTAVVFSGDGKRFAYVGRVGQEYVVVVDGKEQRRFPVASGTQIRMQFTGPEGKHFITTVSQPTGLFEVWVDGDKKLPHDPNVVLMLSRDGSRYAYIATPDASDRKKQVLVVDGRAAAYAGVDPRFTADGAHVLALSADRQAVLVDGAPAVKGMIQRIFVAPAGNKFVTVISKSAPGGAHYVCVAEGKEIAATEGTDQPFVVFSADGKRWAARCKTAVGAYVQWVTTDDGRKGQEYVGIDDGSIVFSPDGSRLAYAASNNSKYFVVIDGKESDGFNYNAKVGFSPTGKVYYGGRQDKQAVTRVLVVEGQEYRGDSNFNNEGITFSPDGSHWAVLGSGLKAGGPTGLQSVDNLLVDGKLIAGFTASNFLFSANGKHIAFIGQRHSDNVTGLFLDDGKPLMLKMGTRGRPYVFSADGQHLFWTTIQTDPKSNNRPTHFVYADGREVAKFDNVSLGNFETDPGAWQVLPDGTLSAVGAVGDKVICYRVTPGDDTNVDSAAKELADADAKAKADADAAKQAVADAAAKKKADADAARQAAADARKAAADERKRQRDEAAAAKKAARGK